MFQSFSSPKRFWFAFTHFGLLQCFMLRIIFMFSGLLSHFSVCITFSYFQILRFTFRLFLVCFIQPVLLAFTVFGTFRCSGLLSDCSWKALWTWHTLWHLMVTGVSTSFLDTGVGTHSLTPDGHWGFYQFPRHWGGASGQAANDQWVFVTYMIRVCFLHAVVVFIVKTYFKIHSRIYFLLRGIAQ